jgi:hypothetical protein
MKCPKCRAETSLAALRCPGCKLKTPRGRHAGGNQEEKAPRRLNLWVAGSPLKIKPWVSWLAIVTTVLLSTGGSYISFMYFDDPPQTQVPLHQKVLKKMRLMPSNQSWMSVEESLKSEVEKSQKKGRLVEAEGWDVRQVEDGSFNVSFTFQEQDNKQQIAIWNVNPKTNSYVPKSDLAEFILKHSSED